jgi:hypothetical protein
MKHHAAPDFVVLSKKAIPKEMPPGKLKLLAAQLKNGSPIDARVGEKVGLRSYRMQKLRR